MRLYTVYDLDHKVIIYPLESVIAYMTAFDHPTKIQDKPITEISMHLDDMIEYGFKDLPEYFWEDTTYNGFPIVRMLCRQYEIYENELMYQYTIIVRSKGE